MMKFYKMHALGNDFVVLYHDNLLSLQASWPSERIQQIADRKRGIGFDQMLWIVPSRTHKNTFDYRIFNADGSEAQQCGNGARCLAFWLAHIHQPQNPDIPHDPSHHLIRHWTLRTQNQIIDLRYDPIRGAGASLQAQSSPVPIEHPYPIQSWCQACYQIHVGNPHLIIISDHFDAWPVVARWAADQQIQGDGINISFITQTHANPPHARSLSIRVYERGVGETQACGSAAYAAALVAQQVWGWAENQVLLFPGGTLTIRSDSKENTEKYWLEGETILVFKGEMM